MVLPGAVHLMTPTLTCIAGSMATGCVASSHGIMEKDRHKVINFFMAYAILILVLALNVYAEHGIIVKIKQGKVRGFHIPTNSGSVIAYLGIPYGEPPTGTQRFKKPEPRKPWQGVYDASKFGGTKDDGNPSTITWVPGMSAEHDSLLTTEQVMQGIKGLFPITGDIGIKSIFLEYKDWEDEHNLEKNREAMELILRDYYMICPMKYFADEMAKRESNIYFYEFNHRSSKEVWPKWMGVIHAAILPFMFGKPLTKGSNFTEEEQLLSKRIMKTWGNFARTGIPHDEDNAFTWPPYTYQEQNHVVLKTGKWEVQRNLYSKRCRFWNFLLPKLVGEFDKDFDGNLWSSNVTAEQVCPRDARSEDSCQSILN
ncbi:acetylcholinesterase-like isoform X3 [Dendrobates tinctorius]|uniref:acetylcholinesterase-like isoform X3 n=1 Tax=Dendrobates tinctorius TaxID=92724 RepID=UPI003CCA17CB